MGQSFWMLPGLRISAFCKFFETASELPKGQVGLRLEANTVPM